MQMNKIIRSSVGADLSCPSPIYRPLVDFPIPQLKSYSALSRPSPIYRPLVDVPLFGFLSEKVFLCPPLYRANVLVAHRLGRHSAGHESAGSADPQTHSDIPYTSGTHP